MKHYHKKKYAFINKDIEIQRQYYQTTAKSYNQMHVNESDEHSFALSFLLGFLDYIGIQSILDIGSGTGRAVKYLLEKCPHIRIMGIEPVAELREIGYASGISESALVDGDATDLHFENGSFDLVCEFGMLHHVRRAKQVVSEMIRVGKKAIFISDCNNFGNGPLMLRMTKQIINIFGLWKAFDWIKTRGKGYTFSEGDGLSYSYSVFNDYGQIRSACRSIHILNLMGEGKYPYQNASHIALLGIKKPL